MNFRMLKKMIHITFAVFFTLTITGVTIQENFCNSKLLSIYFDKTSEKCCDTPCSGCHTKVISFKIVDTFFNASKKISNKVKPIINCPFLTCGNENFILNINRQKIHNHLNTFSTPKFALNRAQLQVFLC